MGSGRCSCSAMTCSKMLRVMSALFFLSTTTKSIFSTTNRLTSAKRDVPAFDGIVEATIRIFFNHSRIAHGAPRSCGRRGAGRCRFVPDYHDQSLVTASQRIAQCSAKANRLFDPNRRAAYPASGRARRLGASPMSQRGDRPGPRRAERCQRRQRAGCRGPAARRRVSSCGRAAPASTRTLRADLASLPPSAPPAPAHAHSAGVGSPSSRCR